MEELIILLSTIGGFLLMLAAGCIISDRILPKWNWLNKQLDKLPLSQERGTDDGR